MHRVPKAHIPARVKALQGRMTLAEKIGQVTQVDVRSIAPAKVTYNLIDSVLSGGGADPKPNTPQSWAAMVRGCREAALRTRPGIPLLYGVDAVHSHGAVRRAEIFPRNVELRDDGALMLVAANLGPEERICALRVEALAASVT